MNKKLLVILGNGFTMDFLNFVEEKAGEKTNIDVTNLFKYGPNIICNKDSKSGLLSYKNCPCLWTLGARPNIDKLKTTSIIEEIVTCANAIQKAMYSNEKRNLIKDDKNKYMKNLYIDAYSELSYYLRNLFVYYDTKIKFEESYISINDSKIEKDEFIKWKWAEFFIKLNKPDMYSEVTIITYNYDTWIERILKLLKIDFNIEKIETNNSYKFKIIKPHGSISFFDKRDIFGDYDLYVKRESAKLEELECKYENMSQDSYTNIIVPPAGESGRLPNSWSNPFREHAIEKARQLNADDDVVICGLSYWHVDRMEIDEILTALDPYVNITQINPGPNNELNAVLISLFENYKCYINSDLLEV